MNNCKPFEDAPVIHGHTRTQALQIDGLIVSAAQLGEPSSLGPRTALHCSGARNHLTRALEPRAGSLLGEIVRWENKSTMPRRSARRERLKATRRTMERRS